MLMEIINDHPQLNTTLELFSQKKIASHKRFSSTNDEDRPPSPQYIHDSLLNHTNGFILQYNQVKFINNATIDYFQRERFVLIHLLRGVFDRVVSNLVSKVRQRHHCGLDRGECDGDNITISYDPKSFVSMINDSADKVQFWTENLFNFFHLPYLPITYESLLKDPTTSLNQLFSFLGCPPSTIPTITSSTAAVLQKFFRVISKPHHLCLANYEEIQKWATINSPSSLKFFPTTVV